MAKRATERSAACATCGKTFARSDTLLRHEKSHHATEDRGPVHRVTNGTFRACCACAQARSRCSGGIPCGRCKTRQLDCVYPNKRRKGHGNEDESQGSFGTMDMTPGSEGESSKAQQQYPSQFQQFVFSPAINQPYSGSGQLEASRVNATPEISQIQLSTPSTSHARPGLATDLPLTTSAMSHLPSVEPNLQDVTSIPRQIQPQEQFTSTSVAVDYHNTFDNSNTAYNGNNLYDESLGLNWIPLSVYPSPYGDMEQDFSFLLPSLSDTASMTHDFDPLAFDSGLATASRGGEAGSMRISSGYHPPSITGMMQSPASTGSDNIANIGFAVDVVDVSGSRKKRRKYSHVPTGFSERQESRKDFLFPDTSMLSNVAAQAWCSESKYSLVATTFQKLCVNSSRWKPFSSLEFPGLTAFNSCIELYFEHLHPTFPLLHSPTFERDAGWLICLAAAAIGSTFADIPERADAREAFQEFLRRAVLSTTDEHDGDFRNIHLAQARILALIGLTQSDREQLRSRAPRSHVDIARWCLESGILQLTEQDEEVRSDEDIDSAWTRWIQRESLRRVGYFIWYLDCALGYVSNARPLCNMDDARAPLPCAESLWNASSSQEWLAHRNNTPRPPSLCAALEAMYKTKKIDPELSEISHILLIHALYSRTWEVGTHIKQPLSEWKATGNAKGFLNTPSKDNFWLPLYPLYANWRNSACDCLDILHWQAAGVAAKNAGAEHHGVLHLHLARVVLLTPFQEIQDLLFFLINHRVSDLSKASFYVHDGSYQPRNPAKLPQIRKITSRWLREDQHKARLAIIHAGSVFWHVRRYSKYSFFEPLAIYLASIVLWTYGSYKSAALERYSAAAGVDGPTMAKQLYFQPDDRSDQVQTEPGADINVQPTRVERAAQNYADSKSHSSRSRSTQNPSTSSNSPVQARSVVGVSGSPAGHQQVHIGSAQIDVYTNNYENNHNEHVSDASSPTVSNSDSEDESPTFIHLDRPCDDEIVQHFVRNGHNMSGYMSNVGDICKTPQKVLLEGAKILRTKLACWGVSREYHDILVRLAEIRKDRERDRGANKKKEKAMMVGVENPII